MFAMDKQLKTYYERGMTFLLVISATFKYPRSLMVFLRVISFLIEFVMLLQACGLSYRYLTSINALDLIISFSTVFVKKRAIDEATMMMDKEVDRYSNSYKSGIIFLLAVSGIWPDHEKYPKVVRNSLTLLAVSAEFAVTFGTFNFCWQNLTNINMLTKGLGLMISFSSSFFKALIIFIRREDVIKLNRVLSDRFEKDLEIEENRAFLLAHYPSFHRYFRLHCYCTGALTVLTVIGPIIALIRYGKYIRAYPQLIPFHYETGGLIHWSIYGFELIEGWYCWSNTVGVDSLFGLYSLHMVGQLKLLAHRFRNLKAGENYAKQLKDCVVRHVRLMESKCMMERIFGLFAVWLAVTCAIVICAIIFQCSQTRSMTIYKVIYLIVYVTIKFIQAYTYAWFGHIINVESEACVHSIYYADWAARGDLRMRKDALIVMSQHPMQFEALGIMIVRLDMFSKIMNTSVSYFFLLKTLDAKLETT